MDLISQLPDDVLLRILVVLPLKKAAATGVLSTRWRDLWKRLPVLRFDFLPRSAEEAMAESPRVVRSRIEIVNSVLASHRSPFLKHLSISLSVPKSAQRDAAAWLAIASSRRVETLALNFRAAAVALDEMLRRVGGGFESLRVLRLKCLKLGGEGAALLRRKCPSLETLLIDGALVASEAEFGGAALEHLDLRGHSSLKSVKISAPNLTWLGIDYKSKLLSLEHVPKLLHMIFVCRFPDSLHDFASAAAQLENLTIRLYYPDQAISVPKMPKLKKLVLHLCQVYEGVVLPTAACLMRACPRLEKFRVETESLMPSKKVVFEDERFQHNHLKEFEFESFRVSCVDHMTLLRCVVDNCVALQKLSIATPSARISEHLDGITLEQLLSALRIKENARQLLAAYVPAHIQLLVY